MPATRSALVACAGSATFETVMVVQPADATHEADATFLAYAPTHEARCAGRASSAEYTQYGAVCRASAPEGEVPGRTRMRFAERDIEWAVEAYGRDGATQRWAMQETSLHAYKVECVCSTEE